MQADLFAEQAQMSSYALCEAQDPFDTRILMLHNSQLFVLCNPDKAHGLTGEGNAVLAAMIPAVLQQGLAWTSFDDCFQCLFAWVM